MRWYVSTFNGILDDLQKIVGPHNLTTPRDADCMVIWQDVLGSYGDLVKALKEVGWDKKIFTVQHGRSSSFDYGKPNSFPLLSDYFLAWGDSDYKRMVSLGYGDKVSVVGCPLNTHIKSKVPHREKVVLFVPVNSGKEEPENIATYYELLKIKYAKAGEKIKLLSVPLKDKWEMTSNEACQNFDVVAKLLPWHDKSLYHGRVLVGQQNTYRNNELVFELLRNVDAVVGIDEGCTEIFAMAHDVPVIVVDGFKYRQHKPDGRQYEVVDIYRTKGATHCQLSDLGEALDQALAHPEHLRQERREIAEAEMGVHLPDPSKAIYDFVREHVRKA